MGSLSIRGILAVTVLGCLTLAAPPTHAVDKGGVVVFGLSGNPNSFDPADHTGAGAMLIKAIHDRLVRFAPYADRLVIEPDLAERWVVSPDGMTWTFYLRKGVKFHDGTPFNSAAVVHYFDRAIKGPLTIKASPLFRAIVKSAEAVDDYTVRVNMVAPHAFFLNRLAHEGASIYSPTAFAKYGDKFRFNPVGTGPFKLTEFVSGDKVVLEANPDYWRGKPNLDGVTVRIVRDSNTRTLQLEAGQIHVTQGIAEEQIPRLQKNAALTVVNLPTVNGYRMTLNTSKPPFNNVQVRQALNYAVDREAIAKHLYGAGAEAITGPVAMKVMGAAEVRRYKYDPEQAKALLASAGYAKGFDFTLIAPSDDSRITKARALAEALRSDFAKVGVRMKIEIAEWNTIDDMARKPPESNTVAATFETRPPATGDASWVFDLDLRSTQLPPKGGNRSFYANPAFDKLLDTATASSSVQLRDGFLRDAQQLVVDDAPWVFLVTPTSTTAYSKKLHKWVIDPVDGTGAWPSEETWLEK